MREHGLGDEETARKHWLNLSSLESHNYIKSIHLWDRIYLEAGEAVLMKKPRGQAGDSGRGYLARFYYRKRLKKT